MCFFPFKDDFFALYGWKALYGDVFRPPGKPMLLSAVLGSGCQITLTIFGTLGMLLKKYLRRSSLNFFIDICRALNNILSRRAAGFHRQAKLFELNFFINTTFLWMVKPDRQNCRHSQPICSVPHP